MELKESCMAPPVILLLIAVMREKDEEEKISQVLFYVLYVLCVCVLSHGNKRTAQYKMYINLAPLSLA